MIIKIPACRTQEFAEVVAHLHSQQVAFCAELKGNEFVITLN